MTPDLHCMKVLWLALALVISASTYVTATVSVDDKTKLPPPEVRCPKDQPYTNMPLLVEKRMEYLRAPS